MFRRNRTAKIFVSRGFFVVACLILAAGIQAKGEFVADPAGALAQSGRAEAPSAFETLTTAAERDPVAETDGAKSRDSTTDSTNGNPSPWEVQVGLGGAWRLGHVCPIGIKIPEEYRARATGIEIATVDGDGVDVVYRRPLDFETIRRNPKVWIPIRIGGRGISLQVRLLDASGILSEREIDPYVESEGYTSTQPLILALGSSMGIEELSRTSADGDGSNFVTAVIDDASQMPPSYRDYSACDLVIVSTSDLALLQDITAEQWNALDTWLQRGGGCVISLGPSVEQLREIAQLASLLPGKLVGVGRVTNPAGLESLVVTDEPLKPFLASLLELTNSTAESQLTLTDSLSKRVPWWVSYPRGHGTIQIIASDLDGESLSTWKDRKLLWEKLVEPYLTREILEGSSTATAVGASSYLGYDDMVGQLRATLDVFASVRVVSFGQVAGMLIGVLILIGPIDYLVSVKWLKRPELSWYIAGSLLVAISLGLVFLHKSIRPDDVLVNTVQIVDVDGESGNVHGRLWSHIYSGNAQQLDIRSFCSDGTPVFLDWQGLPGKGLGGLQSQLNTDRGMPEYAIEFWPGQGSSILGVGIPSAGTKCLTGDWTQTIPITAESKLQQMIGVDQLQGELVNPLDVNLNDAVLFYHNWYYVLNSRIAPGERLSVSSETIPKGISRRLNRQRNVDGKVSATRWNPADRDQLDHLLELMMFYKAASGRNYTSLSNRYQPQVDQSNLLDTDLAILIGTVDSSPVNISVRSSDDAAIETVTDSVKDEDEAAGVNRVWYRITLPVARPSKQ